MKENSVLNFLRENKHEFVSGEELSKKLGVSRAAIWKDMQALRKLGYEIEAQPHLGYRLLRVPDKMFADEIAFGLKTQTLGKNIFSYDEVDSTNDIAFQLGEKSIKEGACVFAEYQKKGRGRFGRKWTSAKSKNLILSVLLRPSVGPAEVCKITLTAAVALVKTIREFCAKDVGIKWPNDILCREKKLAGILTEMGAEADRVNFVVVGIGLNINSAKHELLDTATSLYEIAGKETSRQEVARSLLQNLEREYLLLKKGNFQALAKDWERFSATSGQRVNVKTLNSVIHGQAQGIDEDGALWVRKDNGLQEKILAGDVEHVR